MKLIFFLVAFSLIFIRAYFLLSDHADEKKGVFTITIETNGDYEQIKYAGQIKLTDDETGFKSISPGGYVKFRKNDTRFTAQSNITGEISYTLSDDGQPVPPDDKGKSIIRGAIQEMIAYGFDGTARMERLYQQGGSAALINALDHLKDAGLMGRYIDKLFASDSLSTDDCAAVAIHIKSINSDADKVNFLEKFTIKQLGYPQVSSTWFEVVKALNADVDKLNVTNWLLAKPGAVLYFDDLLDIGSRLNADVDKVNILQKISQLPNLTEAQWINLISKAEIINADIDKVNLLQQMAHNMPKSDAVKQAWVKAAKTINNDADYGRLIRSVE